MNAHLRFGQQLWRVELVALFSLVLATTAYGLFDYYVIQSPYEGMEFALGFLAILFYGSIPTLLIIGPLCTAYLRAESFKLWQVLLVSALPGSLFAFIEPGFAIFLVAVTTSMILLTIGLARLWSRLRK